MILRIRDNYRFASILGFRQIKYTSYVITSTYYYVIGLIIKHIPLISNTCIISKYVIMFIINYISSTQ